MKSRTKTRKFLLTMRTHSRRGNILVLASAFMVVLFAFTAFTVDLGYIALTKTQLQGASDGSALAAGLEMPEGFGPYAIPSSAVELSAKDAAAAVAGEHKNGNLNSTYIDLTRDFRMGTLTWDGTTNSWKTTWGATPYNVVEVKLRRASPDSELSGDSALPLFFAPVIQNANADLYVSASAAMLPAAGIRVGPGETAGVLPMAMDEDSWNDLIYNNNGYDDHSYDPDTGEVKKGKDGIMEIDMFPGDDSSLPSGNRGTIDFGSGSNSTADIERQITDGVNYDDMSYFPNNEIRLDQGPMAMAGDTGISAGFKDELAQIVGQTRILPLFSTVTNPGNNAQYTIVRFVGVRIMNVKLTGNDKEVTVQPASFIAPNTIRVEQGGPQAQIQQDTVFAPLFLYK